MTDKEILNLFTQRSERAITQLSEEYGTLCQSLARNILHCREDEEECISDGYLAFWDSVPPTMPNSVKSYLCQLLRRICVNRFYKNTAQKRNSSFVCALEEIGELVSRRGSPDEVLIVKELTQHINLFLELQDEETQGLFVYRYWYGDSIEELARKFDLKYNTVAVKLKRTGKKLKLYLKDKEMIS